MKIFSSESLSFIVLTFLMVTSVASGCRQSQDEAVMERVELGKAPPPEADAGEAAPLPEPLPPEVLGTVLPKLRRSSRLRWKTVVREPIGHYYAELTSRENGQVIVTFTIEDLTLHPARLKHLMGSKVRIGKRLGEVSQDTRVCILAMDRVEVCVSGPRGHAPQETLDKWAEELRFRKLKDTYDKHLAELEKEKARRKVVPPTKTKPL